MISSFSIVRKEDLSAAASKMLLTSFLFGDIKCSCQLTKRTYDSLKYSTNMKHI